MKTGALIKKCADCSTVDLPKGNNTKRCKPCSKRYKYNKDNLARKQRVRTQEKRVTNSSAIERFWKHVNKLGPEQCWEWKASLERTGYGRLSLGSWQILSHRFSYNLHKGDIPDDLLVCHTCDNRKCCNPNHLWLGTHADNHGDRNYKKRQANGERIGKCKLSDSDVSAIREMKEIGLYCSEIAAMFGVSKNHVGDIVKFKVRKIKTLPFPG